MVTFFWILSSVLRAACVSLNPFLLQSFIDKTGVLEEGVTIELLNKWKPLASKPDFQYFPAAGGEVDKFPQELTCPGTELFQEI